MEHHFVLYRDKAGEHRWKLVASNGRIVADSGEGYKTKTGARHAAEALKGKAGTATIREES